MSEVYLATRIINNADPFTTYIVGDKIDTFYEDTTDSFVVKKNDVVVNSGDSFATASYSGGDFSWQQSGYSYCDSGNLIKFNTLKTDVFPYATKLVLANHPDCGGVVSDISKVSLSVTPASSGVTQDGVITVSAFSSNVVKFETVTDEIVEDNLTPFDFNTQGVPADSVSNDVYTVALTIYPGRYNVAALDAIGSYVFWTDVIVGVNQTNSYGTKYYFDYDQYHTNNPRRVLLKQKDYSGSETEIPNSGENPVFVEYGAAGGDGKQTTILGGGLTVNFPAVDDFQYTSEFNNASEKEWLIELHDYPTGSNTLIQRGFVIPGNYTEPYVHVPYPVSISATDGLADLKDSEYLTDNIEIIGGLDPYTQIGGKSLSGDASIIEILSFCLAKTKTENGLRVAMNTYEDGHDSPIGANGGNETGTADDDPLEQTYINQKAFYRQGQPLDCFEVIENVLQALPEPCRLFSSDGYFYIVPLNNSDTSLAYREYDKEGVFVGNGTLTTQIELKNGKESERVVLTSASNMRSGDTYDLIRVVEKRNVVNNLLNDFDRFNVDGDSFLGWTGVKNGDNGSFAAYLPVSENIWKIYNVQDASKDYDYAAKNDSKVDQNTPYRWQFLFVDGQGCDAYIKTTGTVEYKGLDQFELDFNVFYRGRRSGSATAAGYRDVPYVPMRYMLKVGTRYYQAGGGWTTTETINTYFLDEFNKETKITIDGYFEESVTINTSEDYEVRLYDVDTYQYDVEGTDKADMISDITALSTTNLEEGYRIIARYDGITFPYTLHFYEHQRRPLASDDDINIIDSSKTDFKWVLVDQLWITDPSTDTQPRFQSRYYTTGVRFKTFPDGIDVANEFATDRVIDENNSKTLNVQLWHFDIDDTLNNSERLILNYFKLSDGTATSGWGTGSKKAQDLVSDELVRQFKLPSRIIDFEAHKDLELYPWNTVREPLDDNRVFQINRMSINDKTNSVRGEFESISDDTVAGGGTIGEFKADEFALAEFVI